MSKTPDNQSGTVRGTQQACFMAYTLNNTQPVRCTLIGDEPLFYMDYEDVNEEDALLEKTFGMDAFEKGIFNLQEKLSVLDNLSDMESLPDGALILNTTQQAMTSFIEELGRVTAPMSAHEKTEVLTIEGLETVLRKSRLAAAYLDHATAAGTSLRHSAHVAEAHYDRDAGHIFINPSLTATDQILLAARELRRVWQHRNGAMLHPLTFHPDQAILVNRAQVADLSVAMVRIGWELHLAGEQAPWERLENSSLSDLTHAFARDAHMDFRTLNNGSAASAVFEAWFMSDRCSQQDRKLIQAMLADYHGYVFENAQSSRAITGDLIRALGTVPFGKNYLSPYIQTIMEEALFTEVRDRSNANFLWFIKFERTFRETEQELQTDTSVMGSDDRHELSITKKENRIGTDEKATNIVALPFGKDSAPSSTAQKRRASARGADILSFKQGNPE